MLEKNFLKLYLPKKHQRGLELLESTKLFQAFLGPTFPPLPLPQMTFHGGIDARLTLLTHQWPSSHVRNFLSKIKLSKKNIKYVLSLSSTIKKNIQNMSLSQLRKLADDKCFEDICSLLKAFNRKKDLNLFYDIKKNIPKTAQASSLR